MSARQSRHLLRFQDINLAFLRRLAAAMTEGYEKYEKKEVDSRERPPYWKNYLEGDLKFALGRVSNLIHHAVQLGEQYRATLEGSPSIADVEDHLGHAAANLNMLAEWEKRGLLPNSQPTQAVSCEDPFIDVPVPDSSITGDLEQEAKIQGYLNSLRFKE